jgi:hypothetical protein
MHLASFESMSSPSTLILQMEEASFEIERNARSFEDIETSVVELKRIMFNALYTWIAAHHSLLFSSFSDFLNF